MKRIFLLALSGIFFTAPVFAAPYSDPNKTKMTITVTTANIGEIIKEIGGDKVDVEIMLKPIACPSNNDITPEMVKRVEKSNLILSHPWEKWINRLKAEAGDRGKLYRQVETEGNWMIPYIHIRAAEELKNLLVRLDIENAAYYEDRYTDYAYRVSFTGEAMTKELTDAGAYGKKVIANERIKDFLEQYGFDVIATYGKAEELTAKKLAFLISEGKKQGVKIIVDNLQAGAGTGRELAQNLGAKQAVISNFILGKSYINTLRDNVGRLKRAIQ